MRRLLTARGELLLARVEVADRWPRRMRGYLWHDRPAPGEGLWLVPCNAIHTAFMGFPIDAIFLDRRGVVTRVARGLGPFRLAWGGRGAVSVVETLAGQVPGALRPGEALAWEAAG